MSSFAQLRKRYISQTKRQIRESFGYDQLIIQVISSIEEFEKVQNQLIMRLREWYGHYNPEFEHSIGNNEAFTRLIAEKSRKVLLSELEIKESMGAEFSKVDLDMLMDFSAQVRMLQEFVDKEKNYLDLLLDKHAPHAKLVLGSTLCAKLIRHAGSLQRLSRTTAPTIQIMGAEQALFKHLRKRGGCPKYGYLFSHALLSEVPSRTKGRMARAIADKAAMAFKFDFYKSQFRGDELVAYLQKKANDLALLKKNE